MNTEKSIVYISFLLAFVAGFCDTVTFVAADEIFSAHVTGNFIVFAYELVRQAEPEAWIKLITFPVFFISVTIGGWLAGNSTKKYTLLLVEGLILIGTGFTVVLFVVMGIMDSAWPKYMVAMLVVLAMGQQNAFGKLFSKETYGPTTMMTGNVTQAALEVGSIFKNKFNNPLNSTNLKQQMPVILGFLVGCLGGAIAGQQIGLSAVILPGIMLLFFYLQRHGGETSLT